jgi:hypothetical protein
MRSTVKMPILSNSDLAEMHSAYLKVNRRILLKNAKDIIVKRVLDKVCPDIKELLLVTIDNSSTGTDMAIMLPIIIDEHEVVSIRNQEAVTAQEVFVETDALHEISQEIGRDISVSSWHDHGQIWLRAQYYPPRTPVMNPEEFLDDDDMPPLEV